MQEAAANKEYVVDLVMALAESTVSTGRPVSVGNMELAARRNVESME
jgi:hypothetical protein